MRSYLNITSSKLLDLQNLEFREVHIASRWILGFALAWTGSLGFAQEKSVKPGINDSFRDPNVKEFVGRFEVESRERSSRGETRF